MLVVCASVVAWEGYVGLEGGPFKGGYDFFVELLLNVE